MTELPPDPHERLAPQVLWKWVAGGVGMTGAAAAAAGIAVPVLGEVDGMPGWAPNSIVFAVLLLGLFSIVILPVLRHRSWRYAVRDAEIDLVSGALVRRRTIIPLARVQHVDTQADVLDRGLGIATLRIHTAAGTHEVPGLPDGRAWELRTDIARSAHEPEDV